ncbi:hypothetical protein AAFL23_03140 [Staphylococcus lugdunensis]|uniref:hypothetical protein n=1 Tax=Staphylococcus TaxID=1279 RepID=UPI0005678CB8|nr:MULTISPECIES: hypothetical protein [Staphylococcus]OHQ01019.1 hypothetical protein HMPREF2555_02475 [Staphylococcus sp. HMSC064A01]OHS69923.1 hypothetical protein HMPREF3283_08305 [Staphylococcus sp. HMSC74A08]AMG61740.1 hypothetical protein AL499_07250 [Staphylococcus lugdunensis]MBM0803913.1 hypothetical protein [Staphylococcus lugdunensis]MCH8649101.1 hypothetical protein [Staphylococcus lugdunensis]
MFQAQRIKQVGVGPQQREFQQEIPQAKQVGVGPQQREFQQEILQAKQVGVGPQQRERNKHCELYYELQ